MRDRMRAVWRYRPQMLLGATCALAGALLTGSLAPRGAGDGHADGHGDEDGHVEGVVTLSEEAQRIGEIGVVAAGPQSVGRTLELPGVIHAHLDHLASVSPAVLGFVESVAADVGHRVSRGQALARLRSPSLSEAQSAAETAQRDLALARDTLERKRALAKAGEFAQPGHETARQEYEQAEQTLRLAEGELERTRELVASGQFGDRDLEAARAEAASADAELRRAEQEMDRLATLARLGHFREDPEDGRIALAEAEQAAAEAQGELSEAQAALTLAQRNRERTQVAVEAGAPAQALEAARRELDEAKSARDTAAASLARTDPELRRVAGLEAEGLASTREADAAREAHSWAQTRLADAESRVALAQTRLERELRLSDAGVPAGQATDASVADTKVAEARVARWEAALTQARAAVASARAKYQRRRGILEANIPYQTELSRAEAALQTARATAEQRRLSLARVERLAGAGVSSASELAKAEAAVGHARAGLTRARQAYEREQAVLAADLRTREQLAEAEADVRRGEIRLRSARDAARLLASGRNLGAGRFELTSPLGGTVTARFAKVGDVVDVKDVLFEVASLDIVWVEGGAYQSDIPLVAAGQPVEVRTTAYPDRVFDGTVESVNPLLDEHTRKAQVRVLIDNADGALRPDMFAQMSISIQQEQAAIAVPSAALQDDEGEAIVFVKTSATQFERRKVAVGRRSSRFVEITSGLEVGELVVSHGAFLLKSELHKAELAHEH